MVITLKLLTRPKNHDEYLATVGGPGGEFDESILLFSIYDWIKYYSYTPEMELWL